MADRPYVSFAEVKQKVPIPDALRVFGIADRFQDKKGTLTGVCPLPGHQHGPSPNAEQFKINCKNGVWLWHCFGDCQRGGDVIELVKAITGYDDKHVRFWFAEHFADRLTIQKTKRTAKEKPPDAEPATKKEAPANPGKDISQEPRSETGITLSNSVPTLKPLRFFLDLDPTVPYLSQRGLAPETIRRFGLGLCKKGVLAGYVAIPLFGYPHPKGSNPIGYLGRWPDDDPTKDCCGTERPRYKFPEGFPRNRVLYGLAEALETDTSLPLIVVEGAFKVYHFFQSGFPNTVATFGASLSEEQAALLLSTGRNIVLMYDGDEAGYQGMRVGAGKLITQAFVRVVKLPIGLEPDDLTQEELLHFIP